MAKLTANGTRPLMAARGYTAPDPRDNGSVAVWDYVLRSDGYVLSRLVRIEGTPWGTIKGSSGYAILLRSIKTGPGMGRLSRVKFRYPSAINLDTFLKAIVRLSGLPRVEVRD